MSVGMLRFLLFIHAFGALVVFVVTHVLMWISTWMQMPLLLFVRGMMWIRAKLYEWQFALSMEFRKASGESNEWLDLGDEGARDAAMQARRYLSAPVHWPWPFPKRQFEAIPTPTPAVQDTFEQDFDPLLCERCGVELEEERPDGPD